MAVQVLDRSEMIESTGHESDRQTYLVINMIKILCEIWLGESRNLVPGQKVNIYSIIT